MYKIEVESTARGGEEQFLLFPKHPWNNLLHMSSFFIFSLFTVGCWRQKDDKRMDICAICFFCIVIRTNNSFCILTTGTQFIIRANSSFCISTTGTQFLLVPAASLFLISREIGEPYMEKLVIIVAGIAYVRMLFYSAGNQLELLPWRYMCSDLYSNA